MVEPHREAGLTPQSLDGALVGGELRRQHLDGHLLPGGELAREVDVGHSRLAELLQHLVAGVDNLARQGGAAVRAGAGRWPRAWGAAECRRRGRGVWGVVLE